MAVVIRGFSIITGAAIKAGAVIALLTHGIGVLGAAGHMLAPLVGSLAALPGLLFAAVGAGAAVALGMGGSRRALEGTKGTQTTRKAAGSDTFYRALQPAIRNIDASLPQRRGGFQGVAAAVSGLAGRITGAFRAEGIAPFNRILGSTSTLTIRVGQFLEPVIG